MSCATVLQRHYRGHIGRKVAFRWASLRQKVEAYNALCNGSAIVISRVYRGYIARKVARVMREDLSKYILSLREAEINKEEEEYWASLRFSDWRRRRTKLLKDKVQQQSSLT